MIIGNFDTDKEILIVAEIGNNHEGSYALAEELVGRAADCGVQAVKFQTFKTEQFIAPGNPARFRQLKSYELSYAQFEKLSRAAKAAGLLFLSTPLDLQSAAFLEPLVSAYKIASGDNTFYPLIKQISATGKPVILSGGMADVETLGRSQNLIADIWTRNGFKQDLAVLHCVTAYPVAPAQINLAAIRHLREALGCTVGYSDHALGIDAAAYSAYAGARIIEKHFTIDKNHSAFRDHSLSADPDDMKHLVERVREACLLLGAGVKRAQPAELEIEKAVRRSIAAGRDLPKGTVLTWSDLAWTRPATGLPPGDEKRVLGGKLAIDVTAGEAILPEHLCDPKPFSKME
jgi:N,N'-diacetyllegionaminate synthase